MSRNKVSTGMTKTSDALLRHHPVEDVLALLIGTLMISFGIQCYLHQHFLTGSTAGIAFLAQYVSPWSFGTCFFVINLPFYVLALLGMGWRFTCRTFAAVALLSLTSNLISGTYPLFGQSYLLLGNIQMLPLYASVMGGVLMGVGFLVLFRHGFSLGGINIVALLCQKQLGIRAGMLQMIIDLSIMAVAFMVLPWASVVYSVIGAVVLNLIILLNFRQERYRVSS